MSRWDELALELDGVLKGKEAHHSGLGTYVTDLCNECKSFIEKKLNETIPRTELILCSSFEYRKTLKIWMQSKGSKRDRLIVDKEGFCSSLFTPYYRGIAISLEELAHLLFDPGIYNFIVNVTIGLFDGLLEVMKPWLPEDLLKNVSDYLTVEFLELPIADEAKIEYEKVVKSAKDTLSLDLWSNKSRSEREGN
ncbi:MAG: hypothetical protein ABSE82_11695 [Nitrososphaerales archaeon]